MPQTINVPGVGQLQFPDGMSQADMASAIQRNFPQIHSEPDPEGKAQGKRIMSAIDQANREEGNAITGAGETALNLATGMGSTVVGGFRGLAALATGGSMDDARKAIEDTQHDYTYQPRTGVGKLGSELATVPIMAAKSALSSVGGDVGQAINGQQGRIAGESIGGVLPDVAATVLGARAAMRGPTSRAPVVEQAPAVNYDIPAYQRNGTKPLPEISGPPAPPVMVGPPAPPELVGPPSPPPFVGPSSLAELYGIDVPAASRGPVWPTSPKAAPVEAYAAKPFPSPYGSLSEPALPVAAPLSELDRFANNPVEHTPRAAPNQFDDMLREAGPDAPAPKSPLDALIDGDPASPAAKITAPLRDMSDIDSILQEFGVKTPEAPIPGPSLPLAMPLEAVERASGPVAPLDSALRAPEPAAIPEAAPVPAAPIPGPIAPPEPVAPAPIPGPARQVAPEAVAAPAEVPFVATPEQHVNPALRDQSLQVLRDIGLENIRESAVTGNAAQAAREFQHGKFDEPAGRHWDAQFKAETEAMRNYGNRLVDDTKGRTGLDSESLEMKGRDIAAPYDAMRKYFEDAKANLYDLADKEAAGAPLKSTASIDNLLVDREFNNTALADKTLDLVQAVKQQFDLHKERNGGSLTAKQAEDFRKWLNKRWTPENSKIIGEIKAALDKDVFSSVGGDVYAAARQMHQLEIKKLDDPNGISKLMDSDPRAPINRATPYEAIPNALVKLSNEQFRHIIDTYKSLPPELQPIAQQAIATLKAHYAERLVNAGTETGKSNPRQLWSAGDVKKFAEQNSAKLPMIFDASEMARVNTLLEAGEVLRVNPAYPGAAAQLANASKAGLMTHLLGRAGGGIGALVGSAAGPAGSVGGAVAGEAAAGALMKRSGERKALAEAKAAIINEHRTAPKPRSPVDEWEAGLR